MTDAELLFVQYWTIELGRSINEPHQEELIAFLEGVKYTNALNEIEKRNTVPVERSEEWDEFDF